MITDKMMQMNLVFVRSPGPSREIVGSGVKLVYGPLIDAANRCLSAGIRVRKADEVYNWGGGL